MIGDENLDDNSDGLNRSADEDTSAPGAAPPTDDPWGLRGLTFADLPTQPGDGVFGGVLRHMAALGHPQLQAWAANDAAMGPVHIQLRCSGI